MKNIVIARVCIFCVSSECFGCVFVISMSNPREVSFSSNHVNQFTFREGFRDFLSSNLVESGRGGSHFDLSLWELPCVS